MSEQMSHAKAIGILGLVCLAVALVLGADLFFVLVIVYRAGWLNSLASLIALAAAATVLAIAQFYIAGRVAIVRYPEPTRGVLQYANARKLKIIGVVVALLVALRMALASYLG